MNILLYQFFYFKPLLHQYFQIIFQIHFNLRFCHMKLFDFIKFFFGLFDFLLYSINKSQYLIKLIFLFNILNKIFWRFLNNLKLNQNQFHFNLKYIIYLNHNKFPKINKIFIIDFIYLILSNFTKNILWNFYNSFFSILKFLYNINNKYFFIFII